MSIDVVVLESGKVVVKILIPGPQGAPGGPQGVKGDQGDPGPPGPKGDAGVAGAKGDKGDTGSQGIAGTQGIQGPKGDKGDKGDTGAAGAAGADGVDGADGADGAAGAQGPQGPQGVAGANGVGFTFKPAVANAAALPTSGNTTGDGRVTLDNGHLNTWSGTAWQDVGTIQGPQGIQGTAGAAGAQGPAGTPGAVGPAGPAGTNGINGTNGAQGPAGPQGTAGAQGPQGVAGAKGDVGPQGSVGAQGPAGPVGPIGPQGPQGLQGVKGDTGLQGPAGADGTVQTLKTVTRQSGTTYLLQNSDLRSRVIMDAPADTTDVVRITLPPDLPVGWNAEFICENLPMIFIAGDTVIRNAVDSKYQTTGPGVVVRVCVDTMVAATVTVWSIDGGGNMTTGSDFIITTPPNIDAPTLTIGETANLIYGGYTPTPDSFITRLLVNGSYDQRGDSGQFIYEESDVGSDFLWEVIPIKGNNRGRNIFTEEEGPILTGFSDVGAQAPLPPVSPKLFGFAGVGREVSVGLGTWNGVITSWTRQWFRYADNTGDGSTGGTSVQAAGSDYASTKVLTPNFPGQWLRAKVTAIGPGGSTVRYTDPIQIVAAPTKFTLYVGPTNQGLHDGSSPANCIGYGGSNLAIVNTLFQQHVDAGHRVNSGVKILAGNYPCPGPQVKLDSPIGFGNPGYPSFWGGSDPNFPMFIEADPAAVFTGTRLPIVLADNPDTINPVAEYYNIVNAAAIAAGTMPAWADGNDFFWLAPAHQPNFANIEFIGFRLKNFRRGFTFTAKCKNIFFTDCWGTNINALIDNTASDTSTANVDTCQIRGGGTDGNAQYAVRFQYASKNILLDGFQENGHRTQASPIQAKGSSGWSSMFTVANKATVQDMLIVGCTGTNNYWNAGADPNYWNADCVDIDGGLGCSGLNVEHCYFSRCTDAGVDAKCANVTCYDVTVEECKRSFKGWGIETNRDWTIVNCVSKNPVYPGGSGTAAHMNFLAGPDVMICGLTIIGGGNIFDMGISGVNLPTFVHIYDMDESGWTPAPGVTRIIETAGAIYHIDEESDMTPVLGNLPDYVPTLATTSTLSENTDFSLDLVPDATAFPSYVKTEITGGLDKGLFALSGDVRDQTRTLFMSRQNFENPADSNKDNVYEVEIRERTKFRTERRTLRKITVTDVTDVPSGSGASVSLGSFFGWRLHPVFSDSSKVTLGDSAGTEGGTDRTYKKATKIGTDGTTTFLGSTATTAPYDEKVYFSGKFNVFADGTKVGIGLASRSHPQNTALGTTAHSVIWRPDGTVMHNNVVLDTGKTYTTADEFGLAFDNGKLSNTRTVAGTTGTPVPEEKYLTIIKNGTVVGGPYKLLDWYDSSLSLSLEEPVFAAGQLNTLNDALTIRTTAAEFVAAPPTGFVGWGPVQQLVVSGDAIRYVTPNGGATIRNGLGWTTAWSYSDVAGGSIDFMSGGLATLPHIVFDATVAWSGARSMGDGSNSVKAGGTTSLNPLVLCGVLPTSLIPMDTVFIGSAPVRLRSNDLDAYTNCADTGQGTGFPLQLGNCSNLRIHNMRAERNLGLVYFNNACANILISDCSTFNTYRGLIRVFDTGSTYPGAPLSSPPTDLHGRNVLARVHALTATRCHGTIFQKPWLDIQNQCYDWDINHVYANCGGYYDGKSGFPVGIKIDGQAQDIRMDNVWMGRNAMPSSYVEGDGIECNTGDGRCPISNVFCFQNCDGGIDSKDRFQVISNAVCKMNRRNFRFWMPWAVCSALKSVSPLGNHSFSGVVAPAGPRGPAVGIGAFSSHNRSGVDDIANGNANRYADYVVNSIDFYGDHANLFYSSTDNYVMARFNDNASLVHTATGTTKMSAAGSTLLVTGTCKVFFFDPTDTTTQTPTSALTSVIYHGDILSIPLTAPEPGSWEIFNPGSAPSIPMDDNNTELTGGTWQKFFDANFRLSGPTDASGVNPVELQLKLATADIFATAANQGLAVFDSVTPANNFKTVSMRFRDAGNNVPVARGHQTEIRQTYPVVHADAVTHIAWAATHGVVYTNPQKRFIDQTIQRLDAAGVWAKTRVLEHFMLPGMLDWRNNLIPTLSGTPTRLADFQGYYRSFTVNDPVPNTGKSTTYADGISLNSAGFGSDGSSNDAIHTGWNPSTGGFGTQNDLWCSVAVTGMYTSASGVLADGAVVAGAKGTGTPIIGFVATSGTTKLAKGVINADAFLTANAGGSNGLLLLSRTGASTQFMQRYGATINSAAQASSGLPNAELVIGQFGGLAAGVTCKFFAAGSGVLTTAQATAFNTAMNVVP